MKKKRTFVAVFSMLVSMTVVTISFPSSVEAQEHCDVSEDFGVGSHEFEVPEGVTDLTVDVLGAQGGSLPAGQNPGVGGLGGSVSGVLPVTPGETLQVVVGGQGQSVGGVVGSPEGAGGSNGGGDGGEMIALTMAAHGGAGGGGASTILRGADVLAIAGGGGGAAHGGDGGHGGEVGVAGLQFGDGNAIPGQGGTGTAGGAGGDGDGGGGDGDPGVAGNGGTGGAGGDGGGGGGGGFFGGGGGGGGVATIPGGGSGGGGGSSSGPPGAAFETGVRQGDGLVTITWVDPDCTDVSITKVADPTEASFGSQVTYTLTVSNLGPNDATGVTVTDDLPSQVAYVSDTCGGSNLPPWTWDIGDLAVDATVDCEITVEILESGTIVNTSVVDMDQRDPTPENNEDTAEIEVPEAADLSIVKVVDQAEANVGDELVYTLTVTNHGPDDATGVTVTDDLPSQVAYVSDTCGGSNVPPWTWDVGDLAVDATVECDITVEVLEEGTIVNTSVVEGDQEDPTPENNEDSAEVEATEQADLTIVKVVDQAEVSLGDQVTYTLTVSNLGPDDATGVTVTDDLPSQVVYVSDTCGGANLPPWTWDIGDLAVDASVECDITVEVIAGGTIVNTSVVEGDQEDPTPENNVDDATVTVAAEVDLAIAKTVNESEASVGDQIVYTLIVSNLGPDDATGVEVTDDLPAQLVYVSDNCGGANLPPWTWGIGNLASGASVQCDVTVEVIAGGTIVNTAVVGGDQEDPTPENNVDDATVTVAAEVDLTIVKTVNESEASVGDQVTYTLTVSNLGPDNATGVVVTDSLPSQVAYVSDSCGGTNQPPWTWSTGSLAAGASVQCDITVEVTAGGTITNTASVLADQAETTLANNSDTAVLSAGEETLPFTGIEAHGLIAMAALLIGGGMIVLATHPGRRGRHLGRS